MTSPLSTPIQFLKGVGPYIAGLMEKRGITVVEELFYYFPTRYIDRRKIEKIRELTPGKLKTIIGEVVGGASRTIGARRKIYELLVNDGTGVVVITWFHFNEKYLKAKYPPGKKFLITGDCQKYGAQKQFVHPDIEEWEEDGDEKPLSFVPVYPLTEGLHQKTIRRILFNALDTYLEHLEETAVTVRAEGAKITLKEAIGNIHRPPADSVIEQLNEQGSVWHKRVIYDELFFLQLGLGLKKMGVKKEKGVVFKEAGKFLPALKKLLPFSLTNAQERVFGEISSDLQSGEPMNRLVQGDVGCGKTLLAFMAALMAVENGFQAVIMAPTEILAEQHYLNLRGYADKLGITTGFLIGSMDKAGKDKVVGDLASGKLSLVFGTHALIQEGVNFEKLGLVVIDEQHRFGVMQRAALRQSNGISPHVLIMSATPIPRTLAMGVYGDLDLSAVDELPSGRKPITTRVVHEKQRAKAYGFIKDELAKGRQAYFVYPLIEESEKSDLKDAVTMAGALREVFSGHTVGLLHGRMKGEEKEKIMAAFKKGDLEVLVSTTVIEVGVDVPNATVMVIEHAERFGLAQLHQLRGRVGRGADQSSCFLMAGYAKSEESRFRLNVMEETNDGFKIAEEDLKLRGPGDFMGTRQSGIPEFRLAHLVRDGNLMTAARKRALEILELDPQLKLPEHAILKKIMKERWGAKLILAEVG